jgi:hypothetical protein
MKTTIKLSLLAIVVFLASCATTDVSIVKRKYNNGYYVGINNHKKVSASATEKKEIAENKTEQNNSTLSASTTATESFVAESPKTNTDNTFTASTAKAPQSSLAKTSTKSITKNNDVQLSYNNTKAPLKSTLNAFNQIKKVSKAKKGAMDDQTILLVILAIIPFLSLLAMYLKDGDRITANFWVNLLLHFTFIGYAIFGVLVVLDIFSLA